MRLFIAITVPHELHRYCKQLQSQFLDMKNTREFHLTLQFLGNDIGDAQPIIEALKQVKFEPFDIEMGDAVPFPNSLSPGGVWIRCKESEGLVNLANKVRAKMDELGYKADSPLKAHITLGRYKRPPKQKLEKIKGELHSFTINEFYLIESILTSEGAKYKTLAKFPE